MDAYCCAGPKRGSPSLPPEQENEAVQVAVHLLDAVGGVADELLQRCTEAAGVTV
jgi:hypothetical protein